MQSEKQLQKRKISCNLKKRKKEGRKERNADADFKERNVEDIHQKQQHITDKLSVLLCSGYECPSRTQSKGCWNALARAGI